MENHFSSFNNILQMFNNAQPRIKLLFWYATQCFQKFR